MSSGPAASSPFGIIARSTVGATGNAVSFAFGLAVAPLLAPVLEEIRHAAWEQHSSKLPDVGTLASGVASGEVDIGTARSWAKKHGYESNVFDVLVDVADRGPGVSLAFELRRRGLISEGELRTALKRASIEDQWADGLVALTRVLLSPAELANAVVQGFRDQDTASADAVKQGVSEADFATMVNVTGLPPGPETMLEWLRRGITDEAGVVQAIREGHTKVKYVDEYLEARWRVLSAAEYAGLHLRGWITEGEMHAGGALTGYQADDMDLLYLNRGRPATTRQVHIGWARGGRLAGAGSEREAFSQAVKQSNIRPEYEELLWAQRHTYPSAFVIRALASDGTFDQATTEKVLIESGWVPEYAALAADKWSGGDTAAAGTGKWADRARSSLFTVTKREYMDESIDRAGAEASLDVVGVPQSERAAIFAAWDRENATGRKELTTAQIKAAYKAGGLTQDEALGRLVDAGVTLADAELILNPAGT